VHPFTASSVTRVAALTVAAATVSVLAPAVGATPASAAGPAHTTTVRTATVHAVAARPHRVPAPRVPRHLPTAIEPMAAYVEDTTCDPRVRPGTAALAHLLARTYHAYAATGWASTYACGTDGTRSEHYDGRAIDWMVDVHDRRQHTAAEAFLRWLLGTDRHGNRFAMARRLGVMYVIYDNRMWGAWDGRWEDYDGCASTKVMHTAAYANSCHRTHMHISLSWDGAMKRTSYWTHRVDDTTDYGPCVPAGLNWAPRYHHARSTPCPQHPAPTARRHASPTAQALVTYAGAVVRRGMTGPVVGAVQAALGAPETQTFDTATVRAVRGFQHRHHLHATGGVNDPTWRALLAATH
jgi:hypothetical protein